ncbi:MAG TPA: ABC transporter ATP-binding protein [Candidatus Saccharibacteria bacterium]|jgi:putative ABC transport system ATP-binding protein|nr:ABC transporter ATP-binding protein [Candidatus Saccharibacteria bacterium]
MSDDNRVIDLKDVSKIYGFGEGITIALNEVSLKVDKGEFIVIMGPSGSGKSTLLHILGTLDKPNLGSYKLFGREIDSLSDKQTSKLRGSRIGFVFQDYNLLPSISVIENVAMGLLYQGVGESKRLSTASSLLRQLDLFEKDYYMPYQLSGGQAQRVSIARALITNPDIILADEPTGNLDSKTTDLIMESLATLNKKGTTVIMVTHNPNLCSWAKRVIKMHDGRISDDRKQG